MTPQSPPAPAGGTAEPLQDLTWLFHRCASTLRSRFDDVARLHGLNDARDWVVLTLIQQRPGRQQRELAQAAGFDKTTLMSMIDRLEGAGLVVRTPDPRDRRSRIPAVTAEGTRVQEQVVAARDRAEAELLAPYTRQERELLRAVLVRLSSDGVPEATPCGADA